MNTNRVFFIFLLLLLNSTYAQNSKTDSLFTKYGQLKTDTAKCRIMLRLGIELAAINPDSSNFWFNKAMMLSDKSKNSNSLYSFYYAESLFLKSWIDAMFKDEYVRPKENVYIAVKIFGTLSITHHDSLIRKKSLGRIAGCYNILGVTESLQGNYSFAIQHHQKALDFSIKNNLRKEITSSLNNLGISYWNMSNFEKAVDCYMRALKMYEENNNEDGIATINNNLGLIYKSQKEYEKAINYFKISQSIQKKTGNKKAEAQSNENIGSTLHKLNKNSEALKYLIPALEDAKKRKDRAGTAAVSVNLGNVYESLNETEKSLIYFQQALDLYNGLADKRGMAACLINIGNNYFKLHKYDLSKINCTKGLNIAKEINHIEFQKNGYKCLANVAEAEMNYILSLDYIKKWILLNDSIFSLDKNIAINNLTMKYESEKKQKEIILLEKDKKLHEATIVKKVLEGKKQRIIIFSTLVGLLIVIVFSFFLFRLFLQKKKANIILGFQKDEIASQKEEIEMQRDLVTQQKNHIEQIHEEQTDSIRYAERIQKAVLPVSETALAVLGEHFILYRPKDIVSGDFYFVEKRKNILLVVVADCTGHGVPGAFMSMLGISFLNEIISKEEIQSAGHVLDELRKYVINSLQQKGVTGEQQDGMDMSFCVINTDTLEMHFAGANNPVWIVTTSHGMSLQLTELRPDKQPIGIHSNMHPFTNQTYQLQKGDTIYMMSDGFEDQFGGPNRKKFLAKNLKNLLTANCKRLMVDQKQILETTITDWIGNGEQIDDITVLGIKINS